MNLLCPWFWYNSNKEHHANEHSKDQDHEQPHTPATPLVLLFQSLCLSLYSSDVLISLARGSLQQLNRQKDECKQMITDSTLDLIG